MIAYVFLALAMAYSFKVTIDQGHRATRQLNAQREARANDIVASLAEGSVTGCISANTNTLGMHKVVVGSYNAGLRSTKQFVIEGTLTPPQAKRVQKFSFDTTKQYLDDLPYRDCSAAAERYLKRITDPTQRAEVTASVQEQARKADVAIKVGEPKFDKPV